MESDIAMVTIPLVSYNNLIMDSIKYQALINYVLGKVFGENLQQNDLFRTDFSVDDIIEIGEIYQGKKMIVPTPQVGVGYE